MAWSPGLKKLQVAGRGDQGGPTPPPRSQPPPLVPPPGSGSAVVCSITQPLLASASVLPIIMQTLSSTSSLSAAPRARCSRPSRLVVRAAKVESGPAISIVGASGAVGQEFLK